MKKYTYYIFYPKNWFNLKEKFTCILHVNKYFDPSKSIGKDFTKLKVETNLFCNSNPNSGYINKKITDKIGAIIEYPKNRKDHFFYKACLDKYALIELTDPEKMMQAKRKEANKFFAKLGRIRWKIFKNFLKTG